MFFKRNWKMFCSFQRIVLLASWIVAVVQNDPIRCMSLLVQTNSTIAANQYDAFGINTAFSLEKFRKQLKIDVLRYEQDDMEFEIQGVSCAVRNNLK